MNMFCLSSAIAASSNQRDYSYFDRQDHRITDHLAHIFL